MLRVRVGRGQDPLNQCIVFILLAVLSGWPPRVHHLEQPCLQASGRLCSCEAAGELARQRGAAGTLPHTPAIPASPSLFLRVLVPATSESPCSNTADSVTASSIPLVSMSFR